jgi:hypothetical protein
MLRNPLLQIQVWAPTDNLGIQMLPGFMEGGSNAGGRKVTVTITFATTGTRERVTILDQSRLSTTSRSYIHEVEVLEAEQAQASICSRHGESIPSTHPTQTPAP